MSVPRRRPRLVPRSFVFAALALAILAAAPARAAKEKEASGSGAAWPEITAAEKALTKVPQDPDAVAVVLRKTREGRVVRPSNDYVNVVQYHWRMKILTERGKEYGEVHIRASKGSRVDAIEARTIKPDGSILPVPPDQIFEKVAAQVGSFKVTEKVFNFPAVEPGAIIEYRYRRHDEGILSLDPYYFAGEEFTLVSRLSQGVLADMGYTILCDLCPPDAKRSTAEWREAKQKGNTYTVELANIPGYRNEMLMPPARETTPRLEMVMATWNGVMMTPLGRQDKIFTDWASIAGYASYYYGRAIKEGQGALKPIVAGWTEGITEQNEKVKAILRHVRDDFRYLAYDDIYGFSRSVETMLKEKIADNEDKAVLLLAALKTIGVEGQPVLVAGKDVGSVNPKFYSLTQFSHVIVAIPKPDGSREFLDPTISYAPYGFVPWRDSGAGALVVQGNQGELIDLPVRVEVNTTRYRVTLQPKPGGKADAELQADFAGEDGIDLREEMVPAAESARETWAKQWLENRVPGAVLKSVAFESLADTDKPLRMNMAFEAPGLVTVADDVYVVRACVVSCLGTNPLSRGTRTHPFYIDRGWNREEAVTLKPPAAGMAASQMPPMATARSSAASMSLSCSAQGDESVRCVRQFTAARNRWPATANASLRTMYDSIVQADRTTVAFTAAAQ